MRISIIKADVRPVGRTLTILGGILLLTSSLVLVLALEGPGAPDILGA